jgi:hypothetical protein
MSRVTIKGLNRQLEMVALKQFVREKIQLLKQQRFQVEGIQHVNAPTVEPQ